MSNNQKTLKTPLSFKGKGLHTGVNVEMCVKPAPADFGIVFQRIDIEGQPQIPALCDYVTDTSRGTSIEKNGAKVATVEHIVSALWTLGVDNALIEINAPEVPIMDGSAKEFARQIATAGLEELSVERRYYEVSEKTVFTIPERGVEVVIYPDDEFSVSLHVDYRSKVVGNQYATYVTSDDYVAEIAPCRTFVFLHELEPLFNANLIKGGDLDNAIVVVENTPSQTEIERLSKIFDKKEIEVQGGYINNLQLRFPNEIARHKLLDILGDLAMLGVRIKGKVLATRPGHLANNELVKVLRRNMQRDAAKPRYHYDPTVVPVYDINQIKTILPHRPPFLLVDRIIHIDNDNVAGIKNVTMNEPFFVGHFPHEPVMPGVLIIEAMAQCGGILALQNVGGTAEEYSTYFLRIDQVRFKRKVVPGDTLHFELHMTQPIRRGIVVMEAKAYVSDTVVTEAVLTAQVAKNS